MNIRLFWKVQAWMAADDRELYTTSCDCSQAASEINTAIETALSEGKPRNEVMHAAMAVMRKHADLGAMDSEPLWNLDELHRLYRER